MTFWSQTSSSDLTIFVPGDTLKFVLSISDDPQYFTLLSQQAWLSHMENLIKRICNGLKMACIQPIIQKFPNVLAIEAKLLAKDWKPVGHKRREWSWLAETQFWPEGDTEISNTDFLWPLYTAFVPVFILPPFDLATYIDSLLYNHLQIPVFYWKYLIIRLNHWSKQNGLSMAEQIQDIKKCWCIPPAFQFSDVREIDFG